MRGLTLIVLDLVGIALLVAGPIMATQAWRGRQRIAHELVEQKIIFPAADRLPQELIRYAGTQVRTGAHAMAFADVIAGNLKRATQGRTYSEIAEEWMAGGRDDERLTQLRETVFVGQTLRGSLMAAYQAWQITTLVLGLAALFVGVGVAFVVLAGAWR